MKYDDLLILIPSHSLEDFPTELAEQPAESLLNAFAIAWHPRLLAEAGGMPRWRRADDVETSSPRQLVIVPQPCDDWVSAETVANLTSSGSVVLKGLVRREDYIREALAPLQSEPDLSGSLEDVEPDLVKDFFSLGLTWLMVELLTRQMRNISVVDHVRLESEAVAAARAALAGDRPAAEIRLRRAFETLLECRERFYPVDSYLLDLCLLTPRQATADFNRLCLSDAPFNVLVSASDLGDIALAQPQLLESLAAAIRAERAGLIGGDFRETATPLLSIEHSIDSLRRGRREFERLLGAAPRVWGRRKFGVSPFVPQLLTRFGYAAALHFVIDDGHYPDEEHLKFRWQGCDGTVIDALSRIPLAGDGASSFLRLPQRLAESMDHDHAAGLVIARWPELRVPFLEDLRRGFRFAPVLGRLSTFDRFFSGTDVPGRMSDFKASEYFSPQLVHAVARQQADSISRYSREWKRRHRYEAARWCVDVTALMSVGRPDATSAQSCTDAVEAADPDAGPEEQAAADAAVDQLLVQAHCGLRDLLAPGGAGTLGWLVVNPLSFQRRAAVEFPAREGRPLAEHSLSHLHIDDQCSRAIVELPPCGFVWVRGAEKAEAAAPKGLPPAAEELLLRNEFFEVLLSDVTGGIAQVRTVRRSPNRISQQIAYRFPRERTFAVGEGDQGDTSKSYYSEMRLVEARILASSPALGEIETTGLLVDQENNAELAEYRQVTRVRRGRPTIEIEIQLIPRHIPESDPWTDYLGVRWAWRHESVAVSRSQFETTQPVGDEMRIEAPHFIEIADDEHRTTILTHGLPFHRRISPRMLDTLLVVAGETQRTFRFDVVIDETYPQQAALDVLSPPIIIPTAREPASQASWLFHLSTRNVILLGLRPLDQPSGPDAAAAVPAGCIARVLETEGRHRTFALKCFRTPTAARQRDFTGKTVSDFRISGDEVQIEISPFEVCDIELCF